MEKQCLVRTMLVLIRNGPFKTTCTKDELEQMKLDGIAIASVSANDAYIALTDQPKGGIDDVFK